MTNKITSPASPTRPASDHSAIPSGANDTPSDVIEYFYSLHSAFAWIGAAKLNEIAKKHNRRIIHRPFDFVPVVAAANDGIYPKFPAARMRYFFGREIDRWAEWRNQPSIHTRPKYHDESLALASGMVLEAQRQHLNVDALSLEILGMHWRDDGNINGVEDLSRAANAAKIDPAPLLAAAMSPENRSEFQSCTDDAIARAVFGSPCYFVDGDMFYGQDHLEMLERALTRPFQPSPS